ncbi:MAG TPA: hypothetical protein VMV81_09730 [Phycisphaerae bacterium]|nr:hypothetical protein [Phycisphaerae bacterium]
MPASKVARLSICFAIIAAPTGCMPKAPRPAATEVAQTQPVSTPPAAPDSVFDRPMQRYAVEFTVHRITAPKGAFTGEGGVWKLVTGRLPSARETLRLAANGIRAAIGQDSDRAPLLNELDKLAEPRIAQGDTRPDVNRMLELELGPCAERMSVFYYDESGGIHGRDFVGAIGRVKISYEMRSANLHEVMLVVVPELEEPPGPRRWVQSAEGKWEEKDEERKTAYADLAFQARISQGGFLLIGPTSAVYEQPLLAKALFVQEDQLGADGKPQTRESILVISPMIRAEGGAPAMQAKAPS